MNLVVRILNPKENEKVFDPADGTGGFIVATLAHRLRQLRAEYKRDVSDATQDSILDRLSDYAKKHLFVTVDFTG